MDSRIPLSKLREFSHLITAFGKVERAYYIPATNRKENDIEHSYMLAMLGWYLTTSNNLPFDQEKILKYALAHDLVEVYAGDTYIYSKDQAHLDSKGEREREAAERLKTEFSEFPEIYEYITAYMSHEDPESKFIYALDKILPIIHISADNGRAWREYGVTIETVTEKKASKVALSPDIEPYFKELIDMLIEHKDMYFGPTK